MNIGTREIGEGCPVYVIAEVGGNHDGSLDKARQLIETAAWAGADAAKFQLFNPDTLYPGQHTRGSIPADWLEVLQELCWNAGIEFICSVFDLNTLDQYLEIDPAVIKIASPEAVDHGFVTACAAEGLPLIISTGAMSRADVDAMLGSMGHMCEMALLQCVSAYPADPDELNLRVMAEFAESYAVEVGLSDHTMEFAVPGIAVAAGASIIERHLTLDRNSDGPDHGFATEPDEFQAIVQDIRAVERWMGDPVKRVQPSEDATTARLACRRPPLASAARLPLSRGEEL